MYYVCIYIYKFTKINLKESNDVHIWGFEGGNGELSSYIIISKTSFLNLLRLMRYVFFQRIVNILKITSVRYTSSWMVGLAHLVGPHIFKTLLPKPYITREHLQVSYKQNNQILSQVSRLALQKIEVPPVHTCLRNT